MAGIRIKAGAFSTVLGLVGGGVAMIAPSAAWFGYLLIVAAFVIAIWAVEIESLPWWQRWFDQPDVAGFTTHAVLKLAYVPQPHRQHIFRARDQSGIKLALYISAAETLTLSITDSVGETYSALIPFDQSGIPFAKIIDLSVGFGITSKETILRVAVGEREVARHVVPMPIGHVVLPWEFCLGEGLATGHFELLNGAPFDLYEMASWQQFLGTKSERATVKALKDYYQLTS